jgi:hypothetical protein
LAAATGCGPKPIIADATQLGSVIVYRNGVAYFERYAQKSDKEITLRVPNERVDDFLKSLSIVDKQTGKALPLSYSRTPSLDGYVTMTITLPPHAGQLAISYVTESPAWKPSYRVVLGNEGKAKLLGWAVIDNVSGENWNKVKIGVGSTSALSFRYDLHSVRLVQRETLGGGGELALAPPTGGTPYAVAEKKVRVLGNFSSADVSTLSQEATEIAARPMAPAAPDQTIFGGKQRPAIQAQSRRGDISKLSQDIKSGAHRIRIEGYAQAGDGNPQQASLDRANAMRDQLIQNGVDANRIDVVATGKLNSASAVSVLASDEPAGAAGSKSEQAIQPRDTQPVGQAYFVSDKPMTIAADHSAMVSILNSPTDARRVYFYDPISERGSKTYAFSAVRIANPTEYTLDGGPFTVYAEGQFLGEGLSEPILPKSVAFIPFALDRAVVVDTGHEAREEIDKLVTIQRGIATTETRRIRRTKLTISNRGREAAEVYVRHQVMAGYTLDVAEGTKVERLAGANLFPVNVAGNSAVELVIEEHTPLMKTVDIRTDVGVRDISLYLSSKNVDAELKKKLHDIVEAHKHTQALEERIRTVQDQLGVFRTRVDELNLQLVSLKKVPQSEKLRQNLQTKMTEISDKLQKGTIDVTDFEGQLMTLRIALQDKLADLTLERDDRSKKHTAVANK